MQGPVSRARQQGVSLFVVLVMVLLTTLIVLWGSRSALLNEMITGADSDYQRALEAAQAMVRDAEFDIKGERPDGTPCSGDHCRAWGDLAVTDGKLFYPETINEYTDLETALGSSTPSCASGICIPTGVKDEFWVKSTDFDAMKARASLYGAHTGAVANTAGNPLLVHSPARAWYWVEILPYDEASKAAGGAAYRFGPDERLRPFVYRITAIAQGLKPSTRAVVQTTMVWKKKGS